MRLLVASVRGFVSCRLVAAFLFALEWCTLPSAMGVQTPTVRSPTLPKAWPENHATGRWERTNSMPKVSAEMEDVAGHFLLKQRSGERTRKMKDAGHERARKMPRHHQHNEAPLQHELDDDAPLQHQLRESRLLHLPDVPPPEDGILDKTTDGLLSEDRLSTQEAASTFSGAESRAASASGAVPRAPSRSSRGETWQPNLAGVRLPFEVQDPTGPEEAMDGYGLLFGSMLVSSMAMVLLAYLLADYGRPPPRVKAVVAGGRLLAQQPQPLPIGAGGADAEIVEGGGSRIPWQQCCALAFWFLLLLTTASFTRLICRVGIPHDCHAHMDAVKFVHDVNLLLGFGFVLAMFTGLLQADRFAYVFCWGRMSLRGLIFITTLLGSTVVFGSFDLVPALSHFTLSSKGKLTAFGPLVGLLAAGVVAIVSWHLVWAWQRSRWTGFLTYVVSRCALWGICASYFVAAEVSRSRTTFHLHHYVVGFLLAAFAEFNHPMSSFLLAVGTGVMVQGIAAYDADPIIYTAPDPVGNQTAWHSWLRASSSSHHGFQGNALVFR